MVLFLAFIDLRTLPYFCDFRTFLVSNFVYHSRIIVYFKMNYLVSVIYFRINVVQTKDVKVVIFRPLPLSPTQNVKTTVDNFFNFCGSVTCLLLHFIILRGQKPSFIAITLPTSLELIVPNYSVFLLFRY